MIYLDSKTRRDVGSTARCEAADTSNRLKLETMRHLGSSKCEKFLTVQSGGKD
ncbi:hypothetical protein AVEN_55880-1, partial [Araneus ventricosus]